MAGLTINTRSINSLKAIKTPKVNILESTGQEDYFMKAYGLKLIPVISHLGEVTYNEAAYYDLHLIAPIISQTKIIGKNITHVTCAVVDLKKKQYDLEYDSRNVKVQQICKKIILKNSLNNL